MANPKIEVEIGAVTDGLIRGLDGSILSLKQLTAEAKKIEIALETATDVKSINTYNSQLANLRTGMQKLKTTGIDPLTRATSNYNGVGIEFSRIIQDAPFGIIGVGNNITQLAGTFQQLRASSTSTGAALKTALASIISPANLLVLGISAVTTAFTLYSMGAFDSKDATEELTDATTAAKEELDKYVSSLDNVTKASLTGATATQNELSALKGLQIQAENLNIPIGKRIEAVDELQKQFPDYLGNLTQEQILTGDVGSAYSELTKQLIATGKARASVDSIAKNSIEILQLETRERERLEKIRALETKQVGASTFNPAQSGVIGGNLFSEADIISAKIRDVQKEGIDDRKRINDLTKENLNLESLITSEIEKGGSFTKTQIVTVKELNKEVEILKRTFEDISKTPVLAPRDNPFDGGLPFADSKASKAAVTQGVQTAPTEQMKESMRAGKEAMTSIFKEIELEAIAFNEMITQTLTNGISNAITDLAFSLGEALATGDNVFSAIGKSLLNSIGSFLGELGAQLIQVGVAGLAFATLLETIKKGGPAAIPAAIAAIGVGIALTVASGAFRGVAGKGLSSGGGGGSVGAGVSGQSFTGGGVGGLGGGSRELTGELVVRGNDLVYVLGQSMNKITKG